MNQDIFVIIEHLRGLVIDISYIMLAAARIIAQATNGKVVAILLGHNAQSLAKNLAADQVFYLDHPTLAEFTPEAYLEALSPLIMEKKPRVVLLGNTSIGSDIASVLSNRLNLPLVSQCQKVVSEDNEINMISQICGGKIMAETELPSTTTIITMIPGGYRPEEGFSENPPNVIPLEVPSLENLRISFIKYIEPELGDVDITKEKILVSVGRGIQRPENLELVEELAEALGGEVCASRPVVDQGWLPTSRLVGKSGQRVKPKLYLAFGISGAPEHVEGMSDSEMIIAINTDASAPIFNIAKYGAIVDMFDLIEVLTEKIQQAKS